MVKIDIPSIKQTLASDTGFLLVTTGTGYGFSYLYLLIMGRFLGPEAFGILGALFAIFYIAALVGQALRQAIATNIAAIRAKYGEPAAVSTFVKLGIKLSLLCLLPTLVFIIAAGPISSFFHLTSTGPVIILAFSLFTALILDVVLGLQQGLQKFRRLGITGYTTTQGLKLVLGVVFVWTGWGLMGAVGALLASTAIATLVGLALAREQLARAHNQNQVHHHLKVVPVLLPTLILAVFLAMPASVDVMLVTHFFGGKEAGLYNAVATVGKVVIFLPMAVSFILLPKVTENHTLGQGTRDILLRSLVLTLLLSGGVVMICWVFPDIIVLLFFGEAYIAAGALISLYATAMLLFSLNVVLMHYSLAIRNLRLMLLADMITLVEVVAIVLMHQSLTQIIWILLLGNLLILLVSLPVLILRRVRQHEHGLEG
ncbi:oligosaccharide flippase family protein [Chloroflexota bacterium]